MLSCLCAALLASTLSLPEGSATYDVPVAAPGARYRTFDGTATAATDYVRAGGTVEGATIPITIVGDRRDERDEQFTVELLSPPFDVVRITILDDD